MTGSTNYPTVAISDLDSSGFVTLSDTLIVDQSEATRKATVASMLSSLGIMRCIFFSRGGTLESKKDVAFFEEDGNFYTWEGTYPKLIEEGLTPESTGGIAQGAWAIVGDATLRSDVNYTRNKVIGGNVYPLDISSVAQVGGTVPVGTSFVNTDSGIYRIKPEVSGVIGSISDQTMTIGSTIVYLEKNKG